MKAITAEQMRELDRRTIQEGGISAERLMERAGEGVAAAVSRLARRRDCSEVVAVAGKGNNGGDALAAARHLRNSGCRVRVLLAGRSADLVGDARRMYERLCETGATVEERASEKDWNASDATFRDGIVIDGIIGTGFSGPPRGAVAGAIRFINRLSADNCVLAVDVPSGLDATLGLTGADCVRADLTVTLGLPKIGLLLPGAVEQVGMVEVADIGIPGEFSDAIPSEVELVTGPEVRGLFPRRPRSGHKGIFGHLLIIGGAPGFAGAAAMAAFAALRSGVGRVSVLTPRGVAPLVAAEAPEAMVHAGAESAEGSLAGDCLARWGRHLSDYDIILAGPGMTAHAATRHVIDKLSAGGFRGLVLDADALNVMGAQPEAARRCAVPVAITPHPGEMGRLLRLSSDAVQADRFFAARRAAEATRGTVVLKGAGTLIAETDRPLRVNMNGNPGMAKGGMGDVFAGFFAGIAAQGLRLSDAAAAAAYLHGLAGDLAAAKMTQAALTAMDVARHLPDAFREVRVA